MTTSSPTATALRRPDSPPSELELDDLLPAPRFVEVHRRRVDLPIADVWPAALQLRAGDIRLLGPFMAVRDVPARIRRTRPVGVGADKTMLAEMEAKGFHHPRCDPHPNDGRAVMLSCAAGRFWSPADDAATVLTTADDFLAHDVPRTVRLASSLEAIDRGAHTELITETRVLGTDAAADRTFGRYWVLIRMPSGLIRRSWLAAIERRASQAVAP